MDPRHNGEQYEERKPDYMVLSSFYYGSYLEDLPVCPYQTTFFSNLIYGNTNYTITAKFDSVPIGNQIFRAIWQHSHEFVNPTILVLKRKDINEYA
jgi:hypothetical protein